MLAPPTNATEVIPRIWQGGKPKAGAYPFDLIVLVDDEYQPPASSFPGAQILRIPLNDYRAATAAELQQAKIGAISVVEWYRAGKAILITCGAGLNRSGLVTGLTLKMLGYSDAELVALIRRARGDRAIRNSGFLRFIATVQPLPAPTSNVWGAIAVALGLVGAGFLGARRLFRRHP